MLHTLNMVLRILVAGALGASIGIERKVHLKDAGLRTHFIVAVGAALIMIVSKYGFADMGTIRSVSFDPSRIAAQVVSGIGFLGAGTIIFYRNTVRGLTTAAGLWATAGLGLATGAGMYAIGIVSAALILLGLTALRTLERRFVGRVRYISVHAEDMPGLLSEITDVLKGENLKLERMQVEHSDENRSTVDIGLVVRAQGDVLRTEDLHRSLSALNGVVKVHMQDDIL